MRRPDGRQVLELDGVRDRGREERQGEEHLREALRDDDARLPAARLLPVGIVVPANRSRVEARLRARSERDGVVLRPRRVERPERR